MQDEDRKKLTYAFGHLVSSNIPHAHAADSGDEGTSVLEQLGLTPHEMEIVDVLAEHVAGDYEYTGEATEIEAKIKRGAL